MKTAGGRRPRAPGETAPGLCGVGEKTTGDSDSPGFLPRDCLCPINFLVRVAVCKPAGETGCPGTILSWVGLDREAKVLSQPRVDRPGILKKQVFWLVCLGFFPLVFFLFSMTSSFQGPFSGMQKKKKKKIKWILT